MANSLNKVTLVGNIGRDPEVRSFQNGSKVCNLSLATSERWKDKETNEQKEKTEWHRIVVFNDKLVEIIEKYVHNQTFCLSYGDDLKSVDITELINFHKKRIVFSIKWGKKLTFFSKFSKMSRCLN